MHVFPKAPFVVIIDCFRRSQKKYPWYSGECFKTFRELRINNLMDKKMEKTGIKIKHLDSISLAQR